MQNTPENFTLSPEFQQQLEAFHAEQQAYLDLQGGFNAAVQETRRLEQAAGALEAEANEANASWKEMAKERKADQRKINAEIERSVSLKQQAEGLARTAEVRHELHRELAVPLTKARFNLAGSTNSINAKYREERLRTLLGVSGVKDVLEEIYAITRFNLKTSLDGADRGLFRTAADLDAACDAEFLKVIGIARDAAAPGLVSMPEPVKGEVLASSILALKRFAEAGGEIPLQALTPGGIPSQPVKGLRRA